MLIKYWLQDYLEVYGKHEIYANLVILLYLSSQFTWDKVFKVLGPLPNPVKKRTLLVHILCYISFSYLDEMLNTMCECENNTPNAY